MPEQPNQPKREKRWRFQFFFSLLALTAILINMDKKIVLFFVSDQNLEQVVEKKVVRKSAAEDMLDEERLLHSPSQHDGNHSGAESPFQYYDSYGASLAVESSLLNDHTIHWDPHVPRPWLHLDQIGDDNKPPAMLLLTAYGWNQPNQTAGLQVYRGILDRVLIEGVVNHPWFHPTAWQEFEDGTREVDPNTRYYVFLDTSQCATMNWPNYGSNFVGNADNLFNRTKSDAGIGGCQSIHTYRCQYPSYILKESRLFRTAADVWNRIRHQYIKNARLILFDCKGFGLHPVIRKNHTHGMPISLISQSSMVSNVNTVYDQGLVATSITKIALTDRERKDIETCEAETSRRVLLSYSGNFRSHGSQARGSLIPFHDNNRTIIVHRNELNKTGYTYVDLLKSSIFGAAPRGDNKYSYRLAEVMSAGGIPVVMADDWLWPFRPELIDWTKCAVILPELRGNILMDVLEGIPLVERCKMRQYCLWIYDNYMETYDKVIKGVIEGMELVAQGNKSPFPGFLCSEKWNETCFDA